MWKKQKKSKKKESNIFGGKGNLQLTEEGRNADITVDLVLQARAKLSENKVNGPEDAIVSEMIKRLPMEKIYTFTKCFQGRFLGQMKSPSSWTVVKQVLLRKPDAAPTKGIRSYRAIALTSVMSKWYASCIFLRLEKEKETEKWENLHIGGVEEISCQHLQVMLTNVIQKHWEWQEERNPVMRHGTVVAWTSRRPSMRQSRNMWPRSWIITKHMDGSLRPFCVRCRGCLARPHWNVWKAASFFNQSMFEEAPHLWQKMSTQIWAIVEGRMDEE